MKHTDILFKRFRKHKLKLKLEKCQFMKAECNHSGFIVTSSGVKPDLEKVKAIKTLGPQRMSRNAEVVALCSYYREFVPNLPKSVNPLLL